jgi:DNA-binding transcriptional regulator PaaX
MFTSVDNSNLPVRVLLSNILPYLMSKNKELAKSILSILGAVGLVAVAITAPNLVQVLSSFGVIHSKRNWNVKRSIERMNNQGLVRIKEQELVITQKGRRELIRLSLDEINIESGAKDGKVRLIIFDIPSTKDYARKMFRNKLKDMGFKYLQKSIWAIDSPCENEVKKICKILNIDRYVKIVSATNIL